jgi:hypothetical protein
MSNYIEMYRMIWRSKESRGPDVEMVLPLPVTVAIESKNTIAEALEDFGQIIRYSESNKYDAVFIRLLKYNNRQDIKEKYKILQSLAGRYRVGILIGEDPYSPLMGNEEVLERSFLSLNSDPAELLKSMGSRALIRTVPLDKLVSFRRLFKV